MRRGDDIVELMVLDNGARRMHELSADQHREEAADQPGDDGKDEVKRADVLVIRRAEPAREEGRVVAVLVMPVAVSSSAMGFVGVCRGSGSHDLSLLPDLL